MTRRASVGAAPVLLLALAIAVAGCVRSPELRVRMSLGGTTSNELHVDGATTVLSVRIDVVDDVADELRVAPVLPPAVSSDTLGPVTFSPQECVFTEVESFAVCRLEVTTTAELPATSSITLHTTGVGRRGDQDEDELQLVLRFDPPGAQPAAESERECTPAPPSATTHDLDGEGFAHRVLTSTHPTWDVDVADATVRLLTDGPGALNVGLVLTSAPHDPCVDGPVETMRVELQLSGRAGDHGAVAVRPAVFVGEGVHFGEPTVVRDGGVASVVLTLTDDALTPLGDAPPLRDTTALARVGLMVSVSCPADTTCDPVDRAVTVDELVVEVNG